MYLINPVINSKFSCFNSPLWQHHSFFRHQLFCASKFILYVPSTACGLPAGLNVSERNILTKKSKESKLNRLQFNRFSVLRLSREARERKNALTREARRAHEPHTPISPVSLVSSPDVSLENRAFPWFRAKNTTALQSTSLFSHGCWTLHETTHFCTENTCALRGAAFSPTSTT